MRPIKKKIIIKFLFSFPFKQRQAISTFVRNIAYWYLEHILISHKVQVWACFVKVNKQIVIDVNEISLAHLSSLSKLRFFICLM